MKSKKKSVFVWIVLILGLVSTLFLLVTTITNMVNPIYKGNQLLGILGTIINVIAVVIFGIFLYKLYYLTSDIFKWTNIACGYDIFTAIFGLIGTIVNVSAMAEIPNLPEGTSIELVKSASIISASVGFAFTIIIALIIWIFFYKHLRKAQKNKTMDFN